MTTPAPLCHPIPYHDPATCLDKLASQPFLAFLDSASAHPDLGRYSYLAFDPFAVFKVEQGKASWNGTALDDPPFVALKRKLDLYRCDPASPSDTDPGCLPPFQGGALGYFSYEAGRLLENLPTTTREDERLPDMLLPFYDLVLATDLFPSCYADEPAAWIFSTGFCAGDIRSEEERLARAKERLDWFKSCLLKAHAAPEANRSAPPAITGWRSSMSRPGFEAAIGQTRTHILDGDIFQANITQRFSAKVPEVSNVSGGHEERLSAPTPLAYYQQLRAHNPAPFAAYLDMGDHVIASSSPERFIILNDRGHVETRPIKGTAPRDLSDKNRDRQLADQLAQNDKDRAENVMITDLMRNDLSRVCKKGSIKVPTLCGIESYARVHHLVSAVTGELRDGLGAVALLGASLPGGSITGAPKIRAMEIITDLEDLPRGVYCGAIGYLSFTGAMDTNIAIRTALFRDGKVHIHVGGGITALSEPEEEYEECLHKADAMLHAFGTSLEAERDNLAKGPEGTTGDKEQGRQA